MQVKLVASAASAASASKSADSITHASWNAKAAARCVPLRDALMQECSRCSSITGTCLCRVAQGVLKRIERPLQHSLQKLLTVMMEAPAGLPAGLRGQGYNLIYEVSRAACTSSGGSDALQHACFQLLDA